ncbi:unnamed protein product [Pocillopora meandrina]|uniref:Uncharacterized protein n=1 Tax=Pocillopora meandrina TaxID=46732 RepID=A0AAU9VQQ9_9CNID|nr:unnamed protein product [Pocillopora meandrina]
MDKIIEANTTSRRFERHQWVDEFVPKVVIKDANRPPWIDRGFIVG